MSDSGRGQDSIALAGHVRGREFGRRVVVTGILLAVWSFGGFLPLYGLEPEVTRQSLALAGDLHSMLSAQDTLPNVSLFTLGLYPLVYSVALVQVALVLIPRLDPWLSKSGENRQLIQSYIKLGAILISGILGFFTLDQAGARNYFPGVGFETYAVAWFQIVGGTAVCIAVAHYIDRYGVGYSVILMVSFGIAFETFKNIVRVHDLVKSGFINMSSFFWFIAWLIAGIALSILASSALRNRFRSYETDKASTTSDQLAVAAYALITAYYLIGGITLHISEMLHGQERAGTLPYWTVALFAFFCILLNRLGNASSSGKVPEPSGFRFLALLITGVMLLIDATFLLMPPPLKASIVMGGFELLLLSLAGLIVARLFGMRDFDLESQAV